ncbi:Polypeptide N-acetylgalactosaminyltransferase 35A [Olea europaea subsp. europaea]|uniref:Polypeptide N-acetylgalactosaminyltransferase 35A n=2 Tax=Olea europaea subsp. europaea TaxID=158383 RepID=A0A8S0QGY5_OLEEU|nr:Polypeptide N-acetylgalactosaminyltransferase 35A [Olea europaea subsp. europaea]
MVCLACLLPLFLVPIVNLLPVIFHLIMAKVYGLIGWEYRKPERAPPACPYKPSANKTTANNSVTGEQNGISPDPSHKSVGVDDVKQD